MARATPGTLLLSNLGHFALAYRPHRRSRMLIMIIEPRGADLRAVRDLAARRGAGFVEVADVRLVADALGLIDPDVVVGDLVSLAMAALVRPRARRVWLTDDPTLLDDAQLAAFGVDRVWRSPLDGEPPL
ncbi:MAG: hypothetical protein U0228_19785 [Myxococcaceae bacterium]